VSSPFIILRCKIVPSSAFVIGRLPAQHHACDEDSLAAISSVIFYSVTDCTKVLNSFIFTAASLSTLRQVSDETFKRINPDLQRLSASYQHFSNLADREELTDDEQQRLLEYIREGCSIIDKVQDVGAQFGELGSDDKSAVKGQLLQATLSSLTQQIRDSASRLDLFKVEV
jgi:hypothetical protein